MFDPNERDRGSAFFFQTQAFVADDVVSLYDLFHKWHGPYRAKRGENLALDDARGDVGFSLKKWGYIGYAYRHQAVLRASEDLVLLTWQHLNHKAFSVGKSYRLELSIRGFETDGFVYAKSLPLLETPSQTLRIGVGFELLHGHNAQHGDLKGTARADSPKEYSFQAVSDYRYTVNYLYKLDVEPAEGEGFTTHLSFDYRYRDLACHLLVNDLYGRIRWKNLPYSYVELDSDNKTHDENGYIIYKPTVKGVERYADYIQKLYNKVRVEIAWHLRPDRKVRLGTDSMLGTWFPYFEWESRMTDRFCASLSYETRFHTVGLELKSERFVFRLRSDDFVDPKALGLSIGFRYDF